MASPSSSHASTSNLSSPAVLRRTNRPIRESPYLTHVTRYHDQITLVPPENAGRIRKAKKKKPRPHLFHSASENSSSASLLTSRPSTPTSTTSSSSRDFRRYLRSPGRTSPLLAAYQDWEIPDYPPPSFEEAIAASSSSHPSSLSLLTARHSTPSLTTTNFPHSTAPSVTSSRSNDYRSRESHCVRRVNSNDTTTSGLSPPVTSSTLDVPNILDPDPSRSPSPRSSSVKPQTPEPAIAGSDCVIFENASLFQSTSSTPSSIQGISESPYNAYPVTSPSDIRNSFATIGTTHAATTIPLAFDSSTSSTSYTISRGLSFSSATHTDLIVDSHLSTPSPQGPHPGPLAGPSRLDYLLPGVATESPLLGVSPKEKGKGKAKEEHPPDESQDCASPILTASGSKSTSGLVRATIPVPVLEENPIVRNRPNLIEVDEQGLQGVPKWDYGSGSTNVGDRVAPPIPQRPVQTKKPPPPLPPRRLSVASSNDHLHTSFNSIPNHVRRKPPPPPPRKSSKPFNMASEFSILEGDNPATIASTSLLPDSAQQTATRLLHSNSNLEQAPLFASQECGTRSALPGNVFRDHSSVDQESLRSSVSPQEVLDPSGVVQADSEAQPSSAGVGWISNQNTPGPPVRARRPLPTIPVRTVTEQPHNPPPDGLIVTEIPSPSIISPVSPPLEGGEAEFSNPTDEAAAATPTSESQVSVTSDTLTAALVLSTTEPDFIGYTELDLILHRLENNDAVANGSMYDDLIALSDVIGPAREPNITHVDSTALLEHIFSGKIEVDRRRIMKDGRVKLKLSLLGLSVDKCSICLSQFKKDESASLLPQCQHAFHERCIRRWFARNSSCPLCRAPLE